MWLIITVDVLMVMTENASVNIAIIIEKGLYNKMSYILSLKVVSWGTSFNHIEIIK